MSTELKGTESINGQIMLTRYFGGVEHGGACLQVTPPGGTRTPYLSLTKLQAWDLAHALIKFVNGSLEENDN